MPLLSDVVTTIVVAQRKYRPVVAGLASRADIVLGKHWGKSWCRIIIIIIIITTIIIIIIIIIIWGWIAQSI